MKLNKSSVKECKYFVNGMHCASCEILVEKRLKETKGVKSVKASLDDGSVTVLYEGSTPDVTEINADLSRFGYTLGSSKNERSINTPTISLTSNGVSFNKTKLLALFIGIAIIIGFLMIQKSSLIQNNSIADGAGFLGMVGYGIAAGLSSCAALIGGILLSLVKKWNDKYIDSGSKMEKLQPHFLFHVGRIAGFALLGGLLGLIGSKFELNSVVNSILIVFVSLVMLILALQMLDVKWANKIKITLPKFLGRKVAGSSDKGGKLAPLLIGIATFLLPCAFTLNAQALALTSGSFGAGAFLMFSFAIGTFIPLFLISFTGVNANSKPRLTAIFNRSAGLFMLFLAIYTINSQLNLLNLPSLSDIKIGDNSVSEEYVKVIEGVQVLDMYANGFNYYLTGANTIMAGEPAVIRLDNQGIQGCGTYLAARGLVNGYVSLATGQNIIDLGSPKAGVYKVTCSMGMVEPITVIVK